jgi:RNA polymerase sigma factor (sigma-70 family)
MKLDINALYTLHRKELVNHLLRIVKCPETAQDLVQESYMILARTADDALIEHPRGFLYRTAGNLALDHLRHNKIVARHVEAELANEAVAQSSVESELSKAQWQALLHSAIDELPPRCRDVFILHKIRGMSYREVATMLEISESAVEKHIIKGLLHCRKRLGGHFNFPHDT